MTPQITTPTDDAPPWSAEELASAPVDPLGRLPSSRCILRSRPVSRRDRLARWWSGVWEAITTTPPKEIATFVEVFPGQPGYEDAQFVMHYCAGPRYTFRDEAWGEVPDIQPATQDSTRNSTP
ncbi:MAG: hypothetical protein WC718_00430 [Phycisphaerales bacterium]|jgi:hypothetical protein